MIIKITSEKFWDKFVKKNRLIDQKIKVSESAMMADGLIDSNQHQNGN